MKFKTEQVELIKALNIGSRSLMSKANLPILSNILIKASTSGVEFLTTNLETACRVVVKASVEASGEITVGGRVLAEFISQLDAGVVSVEKLGEELLIESGGFNVRLSTMPAEEFPAIPKVEGGRKLEIGVGDFTKSINRVSFCAAIDESRPILTGVLCQINKKGLSLVATDGFRLGYSLLPLVGGGTLNTLEFIIPARALLEASKIMDEHNKSEDTLKTISVIVADNLSQAVFEIGGVEFTSRLIEGAFPNWEKLIPSAFSTVSHINCDELVRVVKIASIFARESGNIVKLSLEGGSGGASLVVSSTTAQVGSSNSKIALSMKGRGGEIAFNYRYLLEALATIDEVEVDFEMNESLNPGKFSCGGDSSSFFHIIMPVRLQN